MRVSARGPAASNNGMVGGRDGDKYRFTVLADGIVRMEWAPDGVFEDRPSIFAARRSDAVVPRYQTRESPNKIQIITSRFHLTYNKREFSAHGLYALVFGFTRSLWRFKEEGQPNLGGTYRTVDDMDGRVHQGSGKTIDLEQGILSPKGYALLDDSESMLLESDGWIGERREPTDGRIDCYLFAYGHHYRDAIKAFYTISGPVPLLPRWALGNWWSRYYEYTDKSYLELMDRFRTEGIPLSVAVIDMDWHLVEDPRISGSGQTGWTGYTWNRDLFPDPQAFLRELHKRKLHTSLNDHPADGIHFYEDKYEEVARTLNHDTSNKEPIEFNCVDQDYLDAYFNVVLKSLEDDGCDFWWIDWQQGPFSLLKGVDPLWVLNHYHFLRQEKLPSVRQPLIFSRYAGPGSHRYPIGFSGDSHTTWASLDWQPEFTATASNIGYGWWSHDIGGHMAGVMDDELTVRWVQLGVFSPIMRLHSAKNEWVGKEPWKLPAEAGETLRSFLRLRHRLIPYLQTMNVRAAESGEPLVQPMYWEYPENDVAYRNKNQYLFGSEMLVMPITTPSDDRIRLGKVKGWLPPGTYVDYFTGTVYEGNRELWVSRTLHQFPVFLRQGSIVPLDSAAEPDNGGGNPNFFEVVVIVGNDGSFDIIEDPEDNDQQRNTSAAPGDTRGNRDVIPVRFSQESGILKIGPVSRISESSAQAPRKLRSWRIRLLGASTPDSIEVASGRTSVQPEMSVDSNGVVIDIGEIESDTETTLKIGQNPQLRRNDHLAMIKQVIQRAQIEYDVKDAVWEAITEPGLAVSAKVGRVQALDIGENLKLFLMEALMADTQT